MNKWRFFIVASALAVLILAGCAGKTIPAFQPPDLNPKVQSGAMVQKVDNFLVLLDASKSMVWSHEGVRKFRLAKDIVSRLNRSVPDLDLQSAFRSFGHGDCMPGEKTLLINPLGRYTRAVLEGGLGRVGCAGGRSPLDQALDAVETDLQDAGGKIALIIVSDGREMSDAPVAAAERLKARFGDRLCIYTIQVGNHAGGKALLEQIAGAGECGLSVNAVSITDGPDMAGFVEKVFLQAAAPAPAPAAPADSDGDGVLDDQDLCPETMRGVAVDTNGCPLDSDGDGVFDTEDRCPGTPAGTRVDKTGCPLDSDGDGVLDTDDLCMDTPRGARVNPEGCWVLTGVHFDTGRWNIRADAEPVLDEVVGVLRRNPGLKVQVQGHTDNVGAAAFNKGLSERRARSVRDYFIGKGIDAGRLEAEGFGFSRPMYNNDTEDGRAKNRRVQLNPIP